MKKIQISILFPAFSFFYFFMPPVFAEAREEEPRGGNFASAHSEHPPHDHHDPDHMKILRSHDERRKKKSCN